MVGGRCRIFCGTLDRLSVCGSRDVSDKHQSGAVVDVFRFRLCLFRIASGEGVYHLRTSLSTRNVSEAVLLFADRQRSDAHLEGYRKYLVDERG